MKRTRQGKSIGRVKFGSEMGAVSIMDVRVPSTNGQLRLDLSPELGSFDIHMPFTARQRALVDEVMHLEDPRDRLSAVVDRARKSPRLSAEHRDAKNLIAGCASSVWLRCESRDGRCYFAADADSPLVRGLVVLLAEFFSGTTPNEIRETNANPLETLDLVRTLSGTRRNGLAAVRAAIAAFAVSTDGTAPANPAP
jgi:cysteine desulfuration protein SufE